MDKSTLQIVISAKDEVTKELQKVKKELKGVSGELNKMKKAASSSSRVAKKELSKLGNESNRVRGTVKNLIGTFQGLGALRLFGAIGALFALRRAMIGVSSAMFTAAEFETVMSNIGTLFDDTGQKVAQLEKGILSMVKSMPIDPKELGSAAYQIASAGILDTAKALEILKASAKLAVSGLGTAEEATTLMVLANNNFRKSTLTAEEKANVLFKTIRGGITTVAEMSQSFGLLAPLFEDVGGTLEEMSAATAALTQVNKSASISQNSLKAGLVAMSKPTADAVELFDKLGVKTFKALVAQTGGVISAWEEMQRASEGNTSQFAKAIGSGEALTSILSLLGGQSVSFAGSMASMVDGVNVLDEAFLKQQKTMTAQWQLIKNQLNVAMVDIGSKVFPLVIDAVNEMIKAIIVLSDWYKKHAEIIKTVVVPAVLSLVTAFVALKVQILAIAGIGAIRTFFIAISTLAAGSALSVASLTGAIALLRVGLLALAGPVGLLAGAVALVGFGATAKIKSQTRALEEQGRASDKQREAIKKARREREASVLEKIDVPEISAQIAKFEIDDKGIVGLLKTLQEVNNTLDDFANEFENAEKEGIESMSKLKISSLQKIGAIDQSIRGVTQSLADLRAEFEKQKGGDVRSLAESFANAEERVKALKEQLVRATDIQQIFDIKTQIQKEEDALENTKNVRTKFANEIADAVRRAGLSDLERAIEDFNTKRGLAQQAFNENQARLQADRQALVAKRNFEIQAFVARQAEAKTLLEEKLNDITKEKEEFVKKVENELKLESDKAEVLKELFKEAADFRQKMVTDSSSAIQGTIQAEAQLWERLASAIAKATGSRSFAGFQTRTAPMGSFDVGGTVPQTGLFRLHQGETVLTRRESRGGGSQVLVNITGGTFLSEEAAEQMGDLIVDKLKTNIRM